MRAKKCAKCGGELRPKRVALDRRWQGELFVFEDVPVQTCEDCGEIWIDASVASEMEACIIKGKTPSKKVEISAFSLAGVKAA